MSSNGRTIFHRVDEIDIQRIPLANPEVLSEFKNLTQLRLTSIVRGEHASTFQSLFKDREVEVTLISDKRSASD